MLSVDKCNGSLRKLYVNLKNRTSGVLRIICHLESRAVVIARHCSPVPKKGATPASQISMRRHQIQPYSAMSRIPKIGLAANVNQKSHSRTSRARFVRSMTIRSGGHDFLGVDRARRYSGGYCKPFATRLGARSRSTPERMIAPRTTSEVTW